MTISDMIEQITAMLDRLDSILEGIHTEEDDPISEFLSESAWGHLADQEAALNDAYYKILEGRDALVQYNSR